MISEVQFTITKFHIHGKRGREIKALFSITNPFTSQLPLRRRHIAHHRQTPGRVHCWTQNRSHLGFIIHCHHKWQNVKFKTEHSPSYGNAAGEALENHLGDTEG